MPTHTSITTEVSLAGHESSIRGRIATWAIIFAAALGSTFYYQSSAGAGYPLDDSYIHFAFARNLADGRGFGINPDQPTPGATSPMWVLLLSIGFVFGASSVTWPWALGAVILTLTGVAAAAICETLTPQTSGNPTRRLLSIAAGVATASSFPLVWSAAGGMEAPLVGLTTLLALLALSKARNRPAKFGAMWGATVGLAIAARPEGMLLVPIFVACEAVFGGRGRWSRVIFGIVTAALLAMPYMLFCHATTGRLFPNTFYAKTLSTRSHVPAISDLGDLFGVAWTLYPEAILAMPIIVVTGLLCWRMDGLLSVVVASLGFSLALPCSYAAMERTDLFAGGAGNFGRYLFPMFPPLIAMGFAAIARLATYVHRIHPHKAILSFAVIVGITWTGVTIWRTASFVDLYDQNVRDINAMQMRMADVLKKQLPPNSLVAANDVGAVAFFTSHRVLDLVGIVSTDVLNVRRPIDRPLPDNEEYEILNLLFEKRPEALVIFPDWYPGIYQRLRSGLIVMDDVYQQDNITSGNMRMVAYRIDWSRVAPANLRGISPQ